MLYTCGPHFLRRLNNHKKQASDASFSLSSLLSSKEEEKKESQETKKKTKKKNLLKIQLKRRRRLQKNMKVEAIGETQQENGEMDTNLI